MLMALEYHGNFLERSITGTFTDTVDGHLHLSGTVKYTLQRIGSSHAQVVMTVGRDTRLVYAVHVVHQILDLGTVFIRQTITSAIGDIHHCGTRLDDGVHHAGEIFIVCTSGILSIELHIFHVLFGILYGSHGTFNDFLTVGVEFILDMRVTCTDTCMYALMLGILQ